MQTEQRVDGPTANGGTYTIAYYQDDRGEPADRSVATRAEIVEYDAKDEVVFRTYGAIG